MSIRGRAIRPQALKPAEPAPTLPGDPFVAAERYDRACWARLRGIRQWKGRSDTTIKIRRRTHAP